MLKASFIRATPYVGQVLREGPGGFGPVPLPQHSQCLADEFFEYLPNGLLTRNKADALTSHQRARFDVAINYGATQCTRPEMLNFQLGCLLCQLTGHKPGDYLTLQC